MPQKLCLKNKDLKAEESWRVCSASMWKKLISQANEDSYLPGKTGKTKPIGKFRKIHKETIINLSYEYITRELDRVEVQRGTQTLELQWPGYYLMLRRWIQGHNKQQQESSVLLMQKYTLESAGSSQSLPRAAWIVGFSFLGSGRCPKAIWPASQSWPVSYATWRGGGGLRSSI